MSADGDRNIMLMSIVPDLIGKSLCLRSLNT